MAHYNFKSSSNTKCSRIDGDYHFITLSEFDMMDENDTISINSENDALDIVLHEFNSIPAFSPIVTELYDFLLRRSRMDVVMFGGCNQDLFARAIKRLKKAFPEL